VAQVFALLCVAASLAGCGRMWAGIRERDRKSAEKTSQRLAERGQCARAIASAESAQAAKELGDFAAKSTWLKARCLDALAMHEQSLAHWRLLADFYSDSPWAEKISPSLREAIATRPSSPLVAAPSDLNVPKARYSRSAERSHLIGAVVVEFTLDRAGASRQIRVLENPHPLLSSWAIEAIAQAELGPDSSRRMDLPIRSAVNLRFSSHWAEVAAGKAADEEIGKAADEEAGKKKEEKPFFQWSWDREE
jgi:outer membrane biosynthesis protein TonB